MPVFSARAKRVDMSTRIFCIRAICRRRSTNLELSVCGTLITNACCLNCLNEATYGSLQMQIIGRFNSFFFPFFIIPDANFNKKSILAVGAPSISSSMIQFGRRSSLKTLCICVPFSKASRNASGVRSSEAFISTTLYPACLESEKKINNCRLIEKVSHVLTWQLLRREWSCPGQEVHIAKRFSASADYFHPIQYSDSNDFSWSSLRSFQICRSSY